MTGQNYGGEDENTLTKLGLHPKPEPVTWKTSDLGNRSDPLVLPAGSLFFRPTRFPSKATATPGALP